MRALSEYAFYSRSYLTELPAESERVFARLLEPVTAINRTNSKTAFDTKLAISNAIADRDVVGKRRDFLAGIAEAGSTRQDRYWTQSSKLLPKFAC
jgi:hypothetical protein